MTTIALYVFGTLFVGLWFYNALPISLGPVGAGHGAEKAALAGLMRRRHACHPIPTCCTA